MNGARVRLATRWAVALLLLGGSLVPAVTTQAAPSAAQVAEAKRKLEELNRDRKSTRLNSSHRT